MVEFSPGAVALFMLTLARVGGLVSFAPFFGGGSIAIPIRIAMAITFSWVLYPTAEASLSAVPTGMISFVLLLARELTVGIWLAFVARLVFAAFEIAGQLIGFQMGFSFIQAIDPQTQADSPFLGLFLNLIATILFLGINGHHWLILAVSESYGAVPSPHLFSAALMKQLLVSSAQIFILGLRVASPLMIVMFVIDLLVGFLGKSAPQIHVLILAVPIKIMIGFLVLTGIIYSFVPYLGQHLHIIEAELPLYIGALRK